MASRARLTKRQTEGTRQKIQASNIIFRLQKFVEGEVEMSPAQVTAALGLLKKSIPDLKAIEHTGENGGPIAFTNGVIRFAGTGADTPAEDRPDSEGT